MLTVGVRRTAAVATVAAALAVSACGSTEDESTTRATTTVPAVTEPGPFFGECGSVTDAEAADAFGLGEFGTVTRNSVGCEWEIYVGGPSVSFSWFRGSPIGRERAGSDLIGRLAIDVEVGGNPGFMGSAQDGDGRTILCEIGVDFGGNFIHWSVSYALFTPVADPCEVARTLAEASVERAVS